MPVHAIRVGAPEGSYRTYPTKKSAFKGVPSSTPPATKIDAMVREYTGYKSLKEMCKNNPTLRVPPNASERVKRDFAQLRKAYKRVTGKPAAK